MCDLRSIKKHGTLHKQTLRFDGQKILNGDDLTRGKSRGVCKRQDLTNRI